MPKVARRSLFVTPAGETVLIDSGNPGARDLDRIMAVLDEAGVKQIDHLISTHYHVDHIGGMQELAKRVPIKHFVDHGPSDRGARAGRRLPGCLRRALWQGEAHRRQAWRQASDRRPRLAIVTSAGKAIKTALPGGGKPNPRARFQAARCQPDRRERPVGRQRHHVRQVPHDRSRRSARGTRSSI